MLEEAIKTMNMLETGYNINNHEIPAWEGELTQMIQQKIQEKNRQQFAEEMMS